MKRLTSVLSALGLLAAITAHATPFASCISNINNNISFILNEGGGTVTVTYEDGSTNGTLNGIGTYPAGPLSFSLAGHTSYSIAVHKNGTGIPTCVTNIARNTGRGVAANVNPTSPYFGYVYSVIGGAGVVTMRSDGYGKGNGFPWSTTSTKPTGPSVTWGTDTASQYFISVAPDDYVLVSDYASASEGGVIRVDPTFSSANLLLQNLTGLTQNDTVDYNHGNAQSRAIMTLPVGTAGNQIYVVEGTYKAPYNQLIRYDIGNADYNNNGLLPWGNDALRSPDFVGTELQFEAVNPDPNLAGYGSSLLRAGLSRGTNGYFYINIDRANLSSPNLQVWDPTATQLLWSSFYTNNGTVADYTVTGTTQLPETHWGVPESALSPDNRYLALVHGDNHITIFTLTNGIPDLSTEYMINNKADLVINTNNNQTLTTNIPSSGLSARGICWDAANNLWATFNSTVAGYTANAGVVLQISVGRTATAITTGNASGTTGFQIVSPTEVDIAPTQPIAAQPNTYGFPTSSTSTVTRTGDISSPLDVTFSVTPSSPVCPYSVSVTNTIHFNPGQSSTNIFVQALADNIARPTTTVTLKLTDNGSGQYIVGFQNQTTTFLLSEVTPQLVLSGAASSMYKAFSNDYTSINITRWGDTNTAFTTAAFTNAGTAVKNTDFALISSTVSFAKGDLTKTVKVARPLINGQTPVDSSTATYTGDKTIIVGVGSGSGYNTFQSNGVTTLTIVDNANPATTTLFSDPLTDPADAANWAITSTCGDTTAPLDYNVDFGYDLTANNPNAGFNGLIPLPPNGATTALRVTCNKNNGSEACAVNLYPNVSFSGDYAVRFNMYVVQAQTVASSAEGPLFGINHDGKETNWWYSSGPLSTNGNWSADGVWYWMSAWAGGYSSDYMEFTGISNNIPNTGWRRPATKTAASFVNVFKGPQDFTTLNSSSNAVSGLPANGSPFLLLNTNGSWADVEIKTSNNVVTLSIDKQQIFSFSNTNTLFRQGYPMLGYEVPNAEYGGNEAAVFFSNFQVVSLAAAAPTSVHITSIQVSGGNAVVNFTSSNTSDPSSQFTLRNAATADGAFADAAATITGSGGTYQATIPLSSTMQYYRIRRN